MAKGCASVSMSITSNTADVMAVGCLTRGLFSQFITGGGGGCGYPRHMPASDRYG